MKKHEFLDRVKTVSSEKIILFVGSGLVVDLGYPSWIDLLRMGVEFAKQFSPQIAAVMEDRIKKNRFLEAGDMLFEPEVPPSELYTFLRELFDKSPTLPGLLERLFGCPFSAFITTNYDRTIEQCLSKGRKAVEVHTDVNRFSKFNSRLLGYSENLDKRISNGLVLKSHGDITSPADIVLGSKQMHRLKRDDAFVFLYRHLLSSYTIVFLGFSGEDPNFIWHCNTLFEVAGVPPRASYLLHPNTDRPPAEIENANILSVEYSPQDNHHELQEILTELVSHFAKSDVQKLSEPLEQVSPETRDTLALVSAGISQNLYSSSYQCAVTSMVAEAAFRAGGSEDERKLVSTLSRIYHISAGDAQRILDQADTGAVTRALESYDRAKQKFSTIIRVLIDGIQKRSRAFGKEFVKSDKVFERILLDVLVGALSKTGIGLSLSLVDSEAPEGSLLDRVLRKTVDSLKIEGVGELDKEVLVSSFADLFSRPTKEEGYAIATLAQSSVAHALAMTFSGGLERILDLMPSETYLDANVAIPLVAVDHPRSSHYHEFVILLSRIRCEVFLLDVFLNEMVHHCELANVELNEARIRDNKDAREYADFHGPLHINAFISAYAMGAKNGERYSAYLKRIFGSKRPTPRDFRRSLERLGIEVVSTRSVDRSPSQSLAIEIADAKMALMKIKAQILAEDEAIQILWIHKMCAGKHVWFITEDATLRRILRNLPSLTFSQDPPSKGVMPAYGAYLLLSSLSDRPNLESTFPQLLWNPTYLEQVDTMLSSVLRRFPRQLKKLKQLSYLELKNRTLKMLQKEMARSEKDFLKRRAREYTLGQPEMIRSILRELGEES